MKRDFDTALDQCIAWMREGKPVSSCLAEYPEHAHDLRPLLELIPHVAMATPPQPSLAVRTAGREQMLETLARKRKRQTRMSSVTRNLGRWAHLPELRGCWRMSPAWRAAAMLLVIAMCAVSGLAVSASASTVPGDALYPVKLSSQQVQLSFTADPVARHLLQDRFDTQRRSDIQSAMGRGRQVKVEFHGVLQQVETNVWSVGGLPVTLQETTVVVGHPKAGTLLHVSGRISENGLLLAVRIAEDQAQYPRLTETPEPTRASEISPTAPPFRTQVPTVSEEPPKASPTPTTTPAPPATSKPTETPELTRKPGAIDAPGSTILPKPPEEPEHAEEQEETETPEATERPEKNIEPRKDKEPEHTEEHEATEVPEATKAPKATERPEETTEPEPTESPDDTGTPQPTPTLDDEESEEEEEDSHDSTPTETPRPRD